MRTPPLPSLRTITARLRSLHEAWSHPLAGGEYVRLVCEVLGDVAPYYQWRVCSAGEIDSVWVAHLDHGPARIYGWEYVPGDGAKFDATAAARRLLAAARDAGE